MGKMKTIFLHRKVQVLWGILMIVAMLGCNLIRASAPKPATIQDNKNSPSSQAANKPGSGDSNLEMRATEEPATTSVPVWTPELEQVVSKALTTGQAQTVEVDGNLKLDFPAGAFSETPPELVVSKIAGDIPVPLPGDEILQVYDVALGDLHSLGEPMEVTMSYDPGRLKPDVPADVQMRAAMRDGASGRWTVLSSTIDETAHTVTFQTDHLSALALYLHTQNDSTCPTPHFLISYNRDNINLGAGPMKYTSTLNACQTSTHPNFILAVADFLETAYQGYTAANFPFPEGKIYVNAAYIKDSFLWGTDPQFDTLTGELVIGTDSWPNADELRQDCAHELFHYWQYHTLNSTYRYLSNQWWMDATADYAADKVAYASLGAGSTNKMGKDIRANYLEGSLTSTADFHAYSSAHFVDYLIAKSAAYPTLRDLWDASTSSSSAIDDLKSSLSDRLASKFADVYKDFANYLLFDSASPLPINGPFWSSRAVNDYMWYKVGSGDVTSVATAAAYGSTLWGLQVESKTFMSIHWTNSNEGAVYVFFNENGDQRDGNRQGFQLNPTRTATFPMTPDTVVYILMVDPGSSGMEFDLTIGSTDVEMYTVGLQYDSADAKCAENSAWGTPTSFMDIKKDKVAIHYDSKTDDYYWSPGAEHTIVAFGTGTFKDGKLEAALESTDTITGLGVDSSGAELTGSIQAQVSFTLTQSDEFPFAWTINKVSGSSTVDLPASKTRPGYSCNGTVKGVSLYPAHYFPLAR
jgi:hypothetical protein